MCSYCDKIKAMPADEQLDYLIHEPDVRPIVQFSGVPDDKYQKTFGMPLQIVVQKLSSYADFYCPFCHGLMTTDTAEVRRLREEKKTLQIHLDFQKQYNESRRRGRPTKATKKYMESICAV